MALHWKQDQSLGQDLLKILKQRQGYLSCFEAALLVQLSSVQRYEANAMLALRKAAENDFAHCNKTATSAWIGVLGDLVAPSSVEEVLVCFLITRLFLEHSQCVAIPPFVSALCVNPCHSPSCTLPSG
jgi:hypothetical protein